MNILEGVQTLDFRDKGVQTLKSAMRTAKDVQRQVCAVTRMFRGKVCRYRDVHGQTGVRRSQRCGYA